MIQYEAKLKAGGLKVPAKIIQENNRLFFHFPYNADLIAEIKSMEGRKWHGHDEHEPKKVWSIPITERNTFRLSYMLGNDPYKVYDLPLVSFKTERPLRDYQYEMTGHMLTRHYCIVAGEMGLGKTLAAIEAIDQAGLDHVVWVGPSSALTSVEIEFDNWGLKKRPQLFTYEGMKKLVEYWQSGNKAPQAVFFDECSRLKNCTTQRWQAAKHLADAIRKEHGDNGYVVLMTGTPAPKSPGDWWAQCEIARPGFLKEGDIHKFRERLGIIVQKETSPGAGSYPHLITWRDDENKCSTCGELKDHINHDPDAACFGGGPAHSFKPSTNEVLKLANRMKGLVLFKLKKHCLTLPEKQYRLIKCKPTQSILNAAKIIKARASTTIAALTLLRELSDGFQYEEIETGTQTCPLCKGTKTHKEWYDPSNPDEPIIDRTDGLSTRLSACPCCDGLGEITKNSRSAKQIPSPKEKVLKDLLDQHEDCQRLVTYAGFEGSVERVVDVTLASKWDYIRIDGRGWASSIPNLTPKELVKMFQKPKESDHKINFIGQPGAGGMGLTLTASPSILYYSNPFDGEARMQSEDRIHRLGMDENRGATIYDIEHLPSDRLVLDNLRKKRKLQDLSMGELETIFREMGDVVERGT